MNQIKFTIQRVAELEKRVYMLFDKISELEKILKEVGAVNSATTLDSNQG